MRFAPEPAMHSAHRSAHHQARVIDAESVSEQSILRVDHIEVAVTRKFRVHSVARLARFAVTDSVREHDEKFRNIERLIFAEKFTGEFWSNELRTAPGRPVHDENRVGRLAVRIFLNLAERAVMNFQFRQRFAGPEFEVANRVIAFSWRRIIGGLCSIASGDTNKEDGENSAHGFE